jgi:hypothetical protein
MDEYRPISPIMNFIYIWKNNEDIYVPTSAM